LTGVGCRVLTRYRVVSGRETVMDVGDPVREIEVVPAEEPVPVEQPAEVPSEARA
jgi:hypothetical protein